MLRSAALASMVEASTPDALALHQTRLADQGQNPVEDRRVDFMGQARAGLRQPGMVRHPAHGSPVAGTPAATGNPSNATPDRALSRCPRSSPPGACGNSARAAPRARPSWPRNRARQLASAKASKPPSISTDCSGRKTHDPASAASPPSPPSSPPDDPSAVPSPSANPQIRTSKNQTRAACVQCRLRQRAVKVHPTANGLKALTPGRGGCRGRSGRQASGPRRPARTASAPRRYR